MWAGKWEVVVSILAPDSRMAVGKAIEAVQQKLFKRLI